MAWGTNTLIRGGGAYQNGPPIARSLASSMLQNNVNVGAGGGLTGNMQRGTPIDTGGLSPTIGHIQPMGVSTVTPPPISPPTPTGTHTAGNVVRTTVTPPGVAPPTGHPITPTYQNPIYGSDGYGNPFQSQEQADAYNSANQQRMQNLANWNNSGGYAGGSADLNSGDWAGKSPSQLIQMYAQLGSNDPRKWQLANALSAKYGADFDSGAMVNRYSPGGTGYNPNDMQDAYQWANKTGTGGGGGGGGGGSTMDSYQGHDNNANWWDAYDNPGSKNTSTQTTSYPGGQNPTPPPPTPPPPPPTPTPPPPTPTPSPFPGNGLPTTGPYVPGGPPIPGGSGGYLPGVAPTPTGTVGASGGTVGGATIGPGTRIAGLPGNGLPVMNPTLVGSLPGNGLPTYSPTGLPGNGLPTYNPNGLPGNGLPTYGPNGLPGNGLPIASSTFPGARPPTYTPTNAGRTKPYQR